MISRRDFIKGTTAVGVAATAVSVGVKGKKEPDVHLDPGGKFWVNGKPVYRKVVKIGDLEPGHTKVIHHEGKDIDEVLFLQTSPLPFHVSAYVKTFVTDTDVVVSNYSFAHLTSDFSVVIEYTKA